MSEQLIGLAVIIFGAAVLIEGILAVVVIYTIWKKHQPQPTTMLPAQRDGTETEQYEISDLTLAEEPQTVSRSQAPLDSDPSNPPSWKEYSPRPESAPKYCICHPDRPLEPGTQVMWWPHSDGTVTLFCKETVDQFS